MGTWAPAQTLEPRMLFRSLSDGPADLGKRFQRLSRGTQSALTSPSKELGEEDGRRTLFAAALMIFELRRAESVRTRRSSTAHAAYGNRSGAPDESAGATTAAPSRARRKRSDAGIPRGPRPSPLPKAAP